MTTLRTVNLAKSYQSRKVVKDVSLHISQGEIIGLLGPNGAGKTTSFYMIVGLIPCDDGQVLLGDEDITSRPINERARLGVGYLPQEISIFRKLSVKDNILAILQLREDLSDQGRQDQLNTLMGDFNLTHLKDHIGQSLSGGERRRVEIARALASNPRFILLDEPFAGVDPISVGDIKRIINQLTQRKIGVLITDHNVRETLDICHRAYIVNEGSIIAEGIPQMLLQNPTVRKVYLGDEFDL
jgi:lipopolysaccharide export system ATP-binding protein